MKNNSELIDDVQVKSLLDWFESEYTPGEKGKNGFPRAANLMIKGIKGNVIIRMIYEKDYRDLHK